MQGILHLVLSSDLLRLGLVCKISSPSGSSERPRKLPLATASPPRTAPSVASGLASRSELVVVMRVFFVASLWFLAFYNHPGQDSTRGRVKMH